MEEIEKREITNTGKRGNPRWVKGESGNPGGRPRKSQELAIACREMTPAVLETLASIIADESSKDSDKISACRLVLEYGIGKPQQMVTVDISQKVDEMTDEERRARIRELQARMAMDVDYEVE